MLTRVAVQQLRPVSAVDMRRQLLEDAITFYTQLIELNPQDAQTYSERGTVYSLLGKRELQLADAEKALELEPERAEYYGYVMFPMQGSGRSEDRQRALALMQRAVARQPDNALLRCGLAYAYIQVGARDKARAEMQRVA